MKLQIKTLNQKSILIDIEDTKTVYDLKKQLALYPDVGVEPELQKIIYAGKILVNDDQLTAYNIDVKKFLVVMILKQPQTETPETSKTIKEERNDEKTKTEKTKEDNTSITGEKENTSTNKLEDNESNTSTPRQSSSTTTTISTTTSTTTPTTPTTPTTTTSSSNTTSRTEELVANIVSMGYPESEVRTALAASYNNPERAIEYLIEGIPSTTEGSFTDAGDATISPFEFMRNDPVFRDIRHTIAQNPEMMDDVIQHISETNPSILNLINENQQEFLNMLFESSDEDDNEDFE